MILRRTWVAAVCGGLIGCAGSGSEPKDPATSSTSASTTETGTTATNSTASTTETSGTGTTPATTSTPTTGTTLPDPCALPKGGGTGTSAAPLLTYEELGSDRVPSRPIDEAAFTMPEGAAPPLHVFEGSLELHDEAAARMETHVADWWIALGQRDSDLPPVDLAFTQCGRHLIPEQRGRIVTDDPYWDLFVSPGLTWSTPYDEGKSRASFPFALTFKVENCIQNGVMTFLYDDAAVSQVRYQVTQETCPWHVFDLWGQSSATYTPGALDDGEAIRASFLEELDRRYPVVPLEQLYEDYPDVDASALASGLTLDEQTARGIWVDGTLYQDGCPTRFGEYPYCETVALPSYSLAKTLYVSVAMAAMAQEFEEDPFPYPVEDLLPGPAAAAPGQWSGVTLEHLIDMSTGHYRYTTQYDDYMGDFFVDYSLEGRLEASFLYPYQEPPGERVVYLTPNYQIASAALDVYLGEVGASVTDSYDYAVERVYRPLGVDPDSFTTLRTWEGGGANNGTAFGGYGMLLTPQVTVRLGQFLMEGGQIAGEQVLEPSRLSDMMFETPGERGAPMYYGLWHYNNGMWGYPLDAWGCDAVAPFLFGVSGVTVVLAPNGAVYFSYNDTVEYPVTTVLDALDAIAPLCP